MLWNIFNIKFSKLRKKNKYVEELPLNNLHLFKYFKIKLKTNPVKLIRDCIIVE